MTALQHADEAYARRAWTDAYQQLRVADAEQGLDAQHLERLAVAAHCLGRNDESVDAWSSAYAAHLCAGALEQAALAACWCSFGLLTRGEIATGGGWLARAQALCADNGLENAAHTFVLGQLAAGTMLAGDFEAALPMFTQAQQHADRLRDRNAMALGRLGRSQCLAYLGRADEALPLLDEVMVAVTSDDVSPLVAGLAHCAAIECCQQVLDVRRAQDWTAALTRWCDREPDLVPYRGNCLVHRAEILTLHGAWPEAYREALRARDWLADGAGPNLGNAYYRIGELHRLRGELDAAEVAYKQASQHGHETQPGLGLLRLRQGHVDSARAALRRALDESVAVPARARLLGATVEVELAAGDVVAARVAADELALISAAADVPLLAAHARYADGSVALAEGDPQRALGALRSAWATWQQLAAPYESARVRVLIGSVCRALGDEDTAELEFDAARWAFGELGAKPELERIPKLSRHAPRQSPGGLTLREVQVLRLVAAGKSNRTIAEELFLSEKTVHRHLSNIFSKLDVGSRAAATAFAYQHEIV